MDSSQVKKSKYVMTHAQTGEFQRIDISFSAALSPANNPWTLEADVSTYSIHWYTLPGNCENNVEKSFR